MSTRHTPGPWTCERQDSDEGPIYYAVHGEGYKFVTNVEESQANARLIAAAPELLQACKLALGAFERNHAIDWSIIEDAITKAEGRS